MLYSSRSDAYVTHDATRQQEQDSGVLCYSGDELVTSHPDFPHLKCVV